MQSNTSFQIYTQMEKIRKIIWNWKKKTWKNLTLVEETTEYFIAWLINVKTHEFSPGLRFMIFSSIVIPILNLKWFLSIRFFCECFLPLSDFSQIFPRLFPDFSQIAPRFSPDFSQIVPRFFLRFFQKKREGKLGEKEGKERERQGKTTQMYCKASVQHYIGM